MNKSYLRLTVAGVAALIGLTDIILNGSYVSIIVWVIMALVYKDALGRKDA